MRTVKFKCPNPSCGVRDQIPYNIWKNLIEQVQVGIIPKWFCKACMHALWRARSYSEIRKISDKWHTRGRNIRCALVSLCHLAYELWFYNQV